MACLATLGLAFIGFMALALAMVKHQRDLLNRKLSPTLTRLTSVLGWSFVLGSAIPVTVRSGLEAGLALWCALCSMAGLIVVFIVMLRANAAPRSTKAVH